MKIPLKYSGKTIYLTPYNTATEKDILLFNELADSDVDGLMDILKDNITGDINELTTNEKIGILWKIRSLSIGEEIGVKWECKSCHTGQDAAINISEVVLPGKDIEGIQDCFKPVKAHNLQDFVTEDINELELDEFDKLLEKTKEAVTKFDFIKSVRCLTCGEEQVFDISYEKYLSESLSEDTLMSIYQATGDLVFFGKYTKEDVYSMLPFERSIFIGILNTTREEMNK